MPCTCVLPGSLQSPSNVKAKITVPVRLPTVTASGLATLPMHRALVADAHAIVEHEAEPSRPDGVKSANAKFNPTTDKLMLTCEAAMLVRASRALIPGAGSRAMRKHQPVQRDVACAVEHSHHRRTNRAR